MDPYSIQDDPYNLGNLLQPQQMAATPPMAVPGAIPTQAAPTPPAADGGVPEALAAHFARMGIGPQGVIQAAPGGFDQPAAPSLGASLSPAVGPPMSLAPPTPGPSAPTTPGAKPGGLAETLRGVKMPEAPTPQKVSSPAAPRPSSQIKGGELLALLQMIGAGGTGAPQIPSLANVVR